DGKTPGTTEVDVTVTYPDGTTDHIKVPVTVGEEADSDSDMGMGSTDSNNNDGNGIAKAATTDDHDKSNNDKKLPDTGEQPINNGALFGGLFAGIGSLFLLGRRKKDNKENN
ncbi:MULTISPECIES: Rib/alpha-like domain-containing protein, partial [unclassified Mammaliicoccus]